MLRRNIYYTFKPLIPLGLRRAMRSWLAHRKLRDPETRVNWPIMESAGRAPSGWPGWPEEKSFAFVLTHDVEGPEGVANVRALAELEMSLGFRSSFNFIPEGSYRVPKELRQWLVDNGFEVGIHDLRHDGKLYRSRDGFRQQADRINGYLQEWGAVGYRSGFMLHNLAWHHDLEVLYDASTFDTDPFEPQPEGVRTIFPFFVERGDLGSRDDSDLQGGRPGPLRPGALRDGYVELPYTLVQDSTLFFLLGATTTEIWETKLAWIHGMGGMALLNTHPDYMTFGAGRVRNLYSSDLYAGFLRHVSTQYSDLAWSVLPSHLARWFAEASRQPGYRTEPACPHGGTLRGKRAAVVLYSEYPADPRPRRAALALERSGVNVDLICLSVDGTEKQQELVDGINVTRLPLRHRRAGAFIYMMQYGRFLVSAFWFLTRRSLRRRYDLVHVHNMPDFLVFSALIARLRRARIILDLHDPMPELFCAMHNRNENSAIVRLLRVLERWSIRFAHVVLTPNEAFRRLFAGRTTDPSKVHVIMNSPEESIFNDQVLPAPALTSNGSQKPFRLVFHGSIVERHGLDLAVQALERVLEQIPNARLSVCGRPTAHLDDVLAQARERGIVDAVDVHGMCEQPQIASILAASDVGLIPNHDSVFTRINLPTRIFELLAVSKPVAVPAYPGIRDYFDENALFYYEPDNAAALAARLVWIHQNPEETRAIVQRARQTYHKHLWGSEREKFLRLASDLLT